MLAPHWVCGMTAGRSRRLEAGLAPLAVWSLRVAPAWCAAGMPPSGPARVPAEQDEGDRQAGDGPCPEHREVAAGDRGHAVPGLLNRVTGEVDDGLSGQVPDQRDQPVWFAGEAAERAGTGK